MHPSEGVRILLERRRVGEDGASADYLASVFTPESRFDYDARLDKGGAVELTARGEPAGEELEKKLKNIAGSIARAAGRKLADDLPPWPRRINRWRGPGRG